MPGVYGNVFGSVYGSVYGSVGVGEFSEKAIHASVMQAIETNFAAASTVIYDSEPTALEAVSEWCDFDMTVFDDPPQRKTNRRLMRVVIETHVFAKRGLNLRRADELADAVVALFDHGEYPVYDYDVSGSPQVGNLRLAEVKIQERSDQFNDALRTDGKHFLCTVDGLAVELP